MGISQRLTSQLCNPLTHRVGSVPAALMGGAGLSGDWILSTGLWDDSANWDDTQNWQDS